MQYFKHMTNMRNDIKIKRLISKYGLEGYGLYNLILESITESLTTDSPVPDLQETCEDIAEFYNGNTAKINEIAAYMVNQGLIEVDEMTARITCNKIYKYLEQSQTRSKQIREMIVSYKKDTNLLICNENIVSDTVCDKSERIEKNRIEKNRIEKIKSDTEEDNDLIKYKNNLFDVWYNKYDKKVSKEKALKIWNKLSIEDMRLCLLTINKYIMSTPDKQFRKNPDTYLRNKCWKDEIIIKDQNNIPKVESRYQNEIPDLI